VGTAADVAQGDVAVLRGFFEAYEPREDSWGDVTILGMPGVHYVADYKDSGQDMVEYRTYLLGQSMMYWFVFRIPKDGFEASRKGFDSIMAGLKRSSTREAPIASEPEARRVDRIDYPHVGDKAVIGLWRSVDFVDEINQFDPKVRQWQGDLYLKELEVLPGGKTSKAWTWTKGLLLHSGDKTASKYVIKTMAGATYMFLEWKSGDYVLRGMKPKYYVLEKAKAAR
jgi:hypothetical protein